MKLNAITGRVLMAGMLLAGCFTTGVLAMDCDHCSHCSFRFTEGFSACVACAIDGCSGLDVVEEDWLLRHNGMRRVYPLFLNLIRKVENVLRTDIISVEGRTSAEKWLGWVSRYPYLDRFDDFLSWWDKHRYDSDAFSKQEVSGMAEWWNREGILRRSGSENVVKIDALNSRVYLYELAKKHQEIKTAIERLIDECHGPLANYWVDVKKISRPGPR